MRPIIVLLFVNLFLVGCASNRIPPTITQPPAGDLQFSEATADIEQHKATNVRWGGRIVNLKQNDDASYIEIMHAPLGQNGRPLMTQPTSGRFVIMVPNPTNPNPEEVVDVYISLGGFLTVNGNIEGTTQVMVGKKSQSVPLLTANEIYTWRPTRDHRFNDPFYQGIYGPFFYRDLFWYNRWHWHNPWLFHRPYIWRRGC